MTTFCPYHHWIEPTNTASMSLLAFGGWWDADAAVQNATVTPSVLVGTASLPGTPVISNRTIQITA